MQEVGSGSWIRVYYISLDLNVRHSSNVDSRGLLGAGVYGEAVTAVAEGGTGRIDLDRKAEIRIGSLAIDNCARGPVERDYRDIFVDIDAFIICSRAYDDGVTGG